MAEESTQIATGYDSYFTNLIASVVQGAPLAMDFEAALQEFGKILHDISLRQLGVPYSELGIGERRAATKPRLILPSCTDMGWSTVIGGAELASSDTPKGTIAVMRIRGMMRSEGGLSSRGMYDFADDMRAVYQNRNIESILLETDSGGGESTAGNIARDVVSERNKPVIALVQNAGSAAYNAISVADEIIGASKDARAGSIGTFITVDMETIKKYTSRFMDIYSEDSPDKNKPFRKALGGDYAELKAMVTKMTTEFHQAISEARPLRGNQAMRKETLSGGMFNGTESKARGLIDGIGNFNYAISRAKKWAMKPNKN